jgi:flagellar protein FliL
MVFLVPDEDDDFPLEEDSGEKAQLDTEELKEDEDGGADDKVELDLEDAPFLEEDEEEEEEAPPEPVALEEAPEKKGFKEILTEALHNKKIVAAVAVVLLLLVGGLVYLLWFMPEEVVEEVQEEVQEEMVEEEVVKQDYIVAWDEFWVEHMAEDGQVRFLVCKFAAPTDNEKLAFEIRSKKLVLRDAIYYYLKNKDLTFLSDKNNVATLKQDLVGVLNQYLSGDQLEDLLIEEYLVK